MDGLAAELRTFVPRTAGFCFAYWALRQAAYWGSFLVCGRDNTEGGLDVRMKGLIKAPKRLFLASRLGAFVHAVLSTAVCARVAAAVLPAMATTGRATRVPIGYDLPRDAAWDWVLEHSIGYFVNDLLYCAAYEPDPMFVAHHVGYLLGTTPLRFAERGWMLIVLATVLAESTNPLQLVWQSARECGRKGVYELLSLPFTVAFVTARVVCMTLYIADVGVFVFVDAAGPTRWPMAWTWLAFVFGWAASMLWTQQLVLGYVKFRSKRSLRAGSSPKAD